MKISAHRALPLSALLLASLLLISGCDKATPFTAADPAHTGKIEISDEVRQLLPKGAQIYYSKHIRSGSTDIWSVERLDIETGHVVEIINSETSDLTQLLPRDISPDGKTLLVRAKVKETEERILIAVDLKSFEYKYFARGLNARYSPDGKKVAIYRVENPEARENRILRIYILDNSGKQIQAIPCNGRKCYHPDWYEDDTSIVFAEDGPKEGKRHIVIYNLRNKTRKSYDIGTYGDVDTPQMCGNELQALAFSKTDSLSGGEEGTFIRLLDGSIQPLQSKNISGFRCFTNNLSIVGMQSKDQRMHLGVFRQRDGLFHRITPGPSRTTGYLAPVLYVEHK